MSAPTKHIHRECDENRTPFRIFEPSQCRSDQGDAVAIGTSAENIQGRFAASLDLAARIIKRHEEPGDKDICLMLDFGIRAVPARHVLRATFEPVPE